MGRIRDITDQAHQRFVEERGRQQMTQRCGFCDETVEGTFAETRLWAIEHQRQHPEARQRTKFPKHRAGIRTIGSRSLGENIALNRAQGASRWASNEEDE